ncbi:cagY like domain protein [Helicobacter pylori]|nr:cagY like domain protein [Helicobacter pylori PZ5026]MBH0257831.1 cagY like domain protein [Helicobacter pylori]MBH0308157.1 cagY like domain protein [Helicobacter pylori]OOC23851.1 cagY like domain protein [Helicobacter pylori]OOP89434.1 cagY like domain protein [Helicobacter pylori]
MCLWHNMLLYVVCPIKPLMGRDKILQQTPLKLHLIKHKNKAFLKH